MMWPLGENGLMPAWALTDWEMSRELDSSTGERLNALRNERESRKTLRAMISTFTDDS